MSANRQMYFVFSLYFLTHLRIHVKQYIKPELSHDPYYYAVLQNFSCDADLLYIRRRVLEFRIQVLKSFILLKSTESVHFFSILTHFTSIYVL